MANPQLLTEASIMSVNEFRKLTGKATVDYSDAQVKEIIQQLNFLAELYFKNTKNQD